MEKEKIINEETARLCAVLEEKSAAYYAANRAAGKNIWSVPLHRAADIAEVEKWRALEEANDGDLLAKYWGDRCAYATAACSEIEDMLEYWEKYAQASSEFSAQNPV